MAIEIERKFLVINEDWRPAAVSSRHIADHLIARFDAGKARIRVCNNASTLTFKGLRRGIARSEYHIELSADDARDMIAEFSTSPALEKHRFEVEHDGLIWQVDEFGGPLAGLVTVDVELPSRDHSIVPPSWTGAEITGDPRFSSGRLALAIKQEGDLLKDVLQAAAG